MMRPTKFNSTNHSHLYMKLVHMKASKIASQILKFVNLPNFNYSFYNEKVAS